MEQSFVEKHQMLLNLYAKFHGDPCIGSKVKLKHDFFACKHMGSCLKLFTAEWHYQTFLTTLKVVNKVNEHELTNIGCGQVMY